MGKPVKVSNALYEALEQEAKRQDITIQEALTQRLASAETETQQLSTRCDEYADVLRAKESELSAARNAQKVDGSRVSTLQAEAQSIVEALDRAESEKRDLAAGISEWQAEAEKLDETLEHERARRKQQERKYKGILLVAELAILIGAVIVLRKRWQQQSEQAAANHKDERNPDLAMVWER